MEKVELPILKGEDNEKYIPVTVVIGLIVLIIIFILACFSLTFKSTYKLHYSEHSNLDYKVYLKENDIFSEKYLGKDKQYISSLIDTIDTNFKYTFNSAAKMDLKYSYYVLATLSVDSSDGKNIYSSDDTLINRKRFDDIENDTFSVDQSVKINYDKYNEEAKKVINSTGISADATLIVSLYVEVDAKYADFENGINKKEAVTLKIPLTTKTTDIKMDYDISNNDDATLQYRSTIINNKPLFITSIVLAVVDVFAIIGIVAYIVLNRDEHMVYKKKLERILKDYERFISETVITERVEDLMKTRSLRIVVVKSFEGLLDIRDNLGKPILYHEEIVGEQAVFYIINERVGYIYVMNASDFKKNKIGKDN